jgi:hypothetical protein
MIDARQEDLGRNVYYYDDQNPYAENGIVIGSIVGLHKGDAYIKYFEKERQMKIVMKSQSDLHWYEKIKEL